MSSTKSQYKQIVKATSLFGGVQVFTIIVLIVKSKFVALYIGPLGVGIVGLYTTTIALVTSVTNFGLKTSSVKNISEAYATGDAIKVATIIGVLRKLVWFTGLLGTIVMLLSAHWLSEYTFGNSNNTVAFYWLSITLLLNQLSSGQIALLEGTRHLKLLAKASFFGSLIGISITLPIYYIWRIDGIIPVFIITSSVTLMLSYWFSSNIKIEKILILPKTIAIEGKQMLIMGFLIGLTGILDNVIAYVTRLFIVNLGDLKMVGLFTAGFAIVNIYVGMIFSAMLVDYYPRLSAVSKDNDSCKSIINQQAEIIVLILAPLVIFFLVFIKIIILMLYSEEFLSINTMIYWAMLGVLFKAINWSVGIIVLAKGASKLYSIIYIFAFIVALSTNICGYYYYGLEGLGIAFFITNFLLAVQGYFVAKYFYSFSFSPDLIKIFSIHFFLSLLCFIGVKISIYPLNYILGVILLGFSMYYSYFELDKRIGVKNILKKIKSRFKIS